MRKEDKGVIIGQLADTVKQYGHFYLVDTTAMDAAATSDLRKKCFKAGIKLIVVKNSLLPLVVYKSSTVAKDKKHTRKEMENLTRIWEEKKRKEQGKKFDLNDFLRTGKLK